MKRTTELKRSVRRRTKEYRNSPGSFILHILLILSTLITAAVTIFIVGYILIKGAPNLSPKLFAWKYTTENVSMTPAIINTLLMTFLSLLFAVPAGIGAAIYLVEYAERGNKFVSVIRITAETLAGIPSIVYGLFGYLLFVIALGFGLSLLGGALTLAIMILPLIMRTAEEALMSVPDSYREGSYGLGAGRLRTIFKIVLPAAVPGIISGVILGIGRAAGETAALLFVAGTAAKAATSLFSSSRTLAVHMYVLLSEGLYIDQAYAAAVILLLMVVLINLLSEILARKIGRK
ncbi:MAG: phosphate ABC transporter permease PstA [Firmicutes bacterium]|nr:phosphate ABC transporter permease PstA [Bacillota bacterium]